MSHSAADIARPDERTSDLIRRCRRNMGSIVSAEVDAHARWIEGQSNDPLPFYHLAEMCRWYGRVDLWRDAVDIALPLAHQTPEQLLERAHAKLLLGDWSGWRDRESRFFLAGSGLQSTLPHQLRSIRERWDGSEDIADKSLLVMSDGGFGDCIQMLRYVPSITRAVRTVTLALQPELTGFVRHNFPDTSATAIPDAVTESYDRYVSALSLPAMVGVLPTFEPMRAPTPTPQAGTAGEPSLIGLCWAGSPLTHMELRQPLSLEAFRPLLTRSDVKWYSLQTGPRAAELASYRSVALPSTPLTTFAETADLIAGLDAVVTVDTSVAHLAGSLGVQTWLLLHVVADPRWGLEETTPWYPSMRLIRQRMPGDWNSVTDELAQHVTDFVTRSDAKGERPERRAR
jgi:hypothetical protein